MQVAMFPPVPAQQVLCVNYSNSWPCFDKYGGLCKWFKGVDDLNGLNYLKHSLGAEGELFGLFSSPVF